MIDLRILDLQPARTHDFPFKNEGLECVRIGAEYLGNVGAFSIHWNLRLCEKTIRVRVESQENKLGHVPLKPYTTLSH